MSILQLRKILFYLFVALYMVSCPLMILNALGIHYKLGVKGIIKTGVIYLSTIPSQANVYVNGSLFSEHTPATLRDLVPGDYLIKLTLNGFRPWQKILSVQGEKATAAENILLIPNEWKLLEYSASPFRELISIGKQPFLILSKGPLLSDFYVVKWSEGLRQIFFSHGNPITDAENIQPLLTQKDTFLLPGKLLKYYLVRNSPFVLLVADVNEERKYLWVDLRPKHHKVTDITDLFPYEPENVIWDGRDEKNVFVLQKHMLNRLDIEARAIYPHIASGVKALSLFDKKLHIFFDDFVIKQLDYNAANPVAAWENAKQIHDLFSKSNQINMISLLKDTILVLDETGTLLVNKPPVLHLLEHGIAGFTYDENKRRLLLWTNEKIGILNFSKFSFDFTPMTEPMISWLTLDGKSIQKAFWVNNGSQILYQDNNKLFLLESEDFDRPMKYEIITVKKDSRIFYSDEIGVVFYLEQGSGHLSLIEILPHNLSGSISNLAGEKE